MLKMYIDDSIRFWTGDRHSFALARRQICTTADVFFLFKFNVMPLDRLLYRATAKKEKLNVILNSRL